MFPLPGRNFFLAPEVHFATVQKRDKDRERDRGGGGKWFYQWKAGAFCECIFRENIWRLSILVDIVWQLRILFLDREIKGFSSPTLSYLICSPKRNAHSSSFPLLPLSFSLFLCYVSSFRYVNKSPDSSVSRASLLSLLSFCYLRKCKIRWHAVRASHDRARSSASSWRNFSIRVACRRIYSAIQKEFQCSRASPTRWPVSSFLLAWVSLFNYPSLPSCLSFLSFLLFYETICRWNTRSPFVRDARHEILSGLLSFDT